MVLSLSAMIIGQTPQPEQNLPPHEGGENAAPPPEHQDDDAYGYDGELVYDEEYPAAAVQAISNLTVTTEGQLRDAIAGAGTEPAVININADIALTGGTLMIAGGQNLTLQGTGSITSAPGSRTINLGVMGSVGTGSPSTLTLRGNLTLYGNGITVNGGGILVTNGSVLNMYDNVTITNHLTAGGGQPHFGPIGVIRLWDGGTFNMRGGSIIGNRTLSGGAVHVGVTSTFNMYSGTIAHNSATGGDAGGGGGAGVGAGVRLDSTSAIFNMGGGAIRNNTTLATNGHGGGVAAISGATFNMYAGVIRGNNASSATSQGGGVVVLYDSTFNMYGGTVEDNIAEQGGGVVISAESGQPSSTFAMHTGAVITDNTSRTFAGGGVMIHGGSTFTMHGGQISLNLNGAATGRGGGVAVDGSSTFIMNSGAIVGNTGGISGGGVFINAGSTFNMSGGSVVRDNAAVYGGGIFIANGATLGVTGSSRITGNTAVNNGGGIGAENYGNITVDTTTIFAGNRASSRHDLSLHEDYPSIVTAIPAAYNGLPGGVVGNASGVAWYSVSIPLAHALNNYDVNFIGRQIPELLVVFHGEGGTILPGNETRPVLEGRSLAQMLAIAGPGAGMPPDPTRFDFDFGGWFFMEGGQRVWFYPTTAVTTQMVNENGELHVFAIWLREPRPPQGNPLPRTHPPSRIAPPQPSAPPQTTIPPWDTFNPPMGSTGASGHASLIVIAILSGSAAPLVLLADKKYGKESAGEKNKS